jgi:hypothetical protein
MWYWALEWSRTRKARRAVVAAISPIVEDSRHRLGGISDVAWSDPYIIGFMVMLISIIARIQSGKISEDSLCLVQCRSWEDITAMQSELDDRAIAPPECGSQSRLRVRMPQCSRVQLGVVWHHDTQLQEGAGLPSPRRWRDNLKANLTVRATCGVSSMWTQFLGVHSLQMYQNAAPAR